MISDLEGVLNTELGLEYCGEMEDLYEDMLRDYLDGDHTAELEKHFADENWADYRVVIHGVKSTTLMIGGEELSEKAKELEFAAADKNVDFIKANHASVLEQYKTLMDKIRAAIS